MLIICISNETFVIVILIDFWFPNFYHLKQLEPLKPFITVYKTKDMLLFRKIIRQNICKANSCLESIV